MDAVLAGSFGGVGVFALAIAGALARRPLRLMRAGGRTRGVVERSEARVESTRGGSRTYHIPVIAFQAAGGNPVVFQSSAGGRNALAPGTGVDVIYDPANPRDAEIASFRTLWLFPVVTALFGLPFLVAGLAALLR